MSIRIVIVGAGKRAESTYVPVLKPLILSGSVEVVGVCDTRENRALLVARLLGGCRIFLDVDEMISTVRPTGVILSVSVLAKDLLAYRLLVAGLHLFIETPLGWHPLAAQKIARLAQRHTVAVEVAEDEAFWPIAQQQTIAVQSGAIGKVKRVVNVNKEYAYHGLARLKSLLPVNDTPVSYVGNTLRFRSGAEYTYKFTSRYAQPSEQPPYWKIEGSKQTLLDTATQEHHAEGVEMLLRGWLRAIGEQGRVLYGVERGMQDVLYWRAMELAGKTPWILWPAPVLHAATRVLWGGYEGLRIIKM